MHRFAVGAHATLPITQLDVHQDDGHPIDIDRRRDTVTPQVSADGIIHLSIRPSITERTGTATSRLGDTVPIISVRETDTLVRVRQGETIVIAGLRASTSREIQRLDEPRALAAKTR